MRWKGMILLTISSFAQLILIWQLSSMFWYRLHVLPRLHTFIFICRLYGIIIYAYQCIHYVYLYVYMYIVLNIYLNMYIYSYIFAHIYTVLYMHMSVGVCALLIMAFVQQSICVGMLLFIDSLSISFLLCFLSFYYYIFLSL